MYAYQSPTEKWLDCPDCGPVELYDGKRVELQEMTYVMTCDAEWSNDDDCYYFKSEPCGSAQCWQCPDCSNWHDDDEDNYYLANLMRPYWMCGRCGDAFMDEEDAIACCKEESES